MDQEEISVEQLDWIPVPSQLRDGLQNQPLSKRQMRNWSLVLQSRRIRFRIRRVQQGWQLQVPVERYQKALDELRTFEQANRNWPPPLPQLPQQKENTASTIWVLICLGLFHILTQKQVSLLGHAAVDWYGLGNADAGKILDGQWWRLVTALTLHSGGVHLTGNIVVGGIFANRLCRELGGGVGWSLLLLCGAGGNLLNALMQSPSHRSIGASTAVFAAVGLLAAINMMRYRGNLRHRWPLPVAAALGLLALLGVGGENTDIGAHLFGFACGTLAGILYGKFASDTPPSGKVNLLLVLFSLLLPLSCWLLALLFG
ncbi:Rhomboid family protein [Malonomonas rubra DSM 5091]|uniref:Rhomboid family protein n=1 Tax=Malonomonas rubra DSM 5091 TaxID=1122189 RepID=A0A1M6FID3_MALRU|nr:rhomboid family intramembrane serine protease [Malonomonas rubra]SHI97372.1 Rhomboid family protein [Malonomonas rubra DSM 5091]